MYFVIINFYIYSSAINIFYMILTPRSSEKLHAIFLILALYSWLAMNINLTIKTLRACNMIRHAIKGLESSIPLVRSRT